MSVLDRSALEASPLSDLHAIASELGLDGYRRLRKPELIDAILASEGGGGEAGGADEHRAGDGADADAVEGDRAEAGEDVDAAAVVEQAEEGVTDERSEAREARPRPRRRGGRGRGRQRVESDPSTREEEVEPAAVEGTIELLGNGSGFVRVAPPEPSDDDVYVSAAQVRRCELVSGDVVTGPVRPPRRSERFPSLVRVDTINGAPADEVAEGTRYDDLPASFPTERFVLGSEDPTLAAIESLTPLGRGSRVALIGPPQAGKTEALRRLAAALAAIEGLELFLVLAGARPEEVGEWESGPVAPTATVKLGASSTSREQAVEGAVEQGRRIAARGGNAVVLIDSLDGLDPLAARRALAAARNIPDGGSLTVVATSWVAVGGETTVIAFDPRLAGARRFPAISVAASGTMRPELLVGEAGAEEIARATGDALT